MMAYAITENGWRGVETDWPLESGETYAEELPQWLVDKQIHEELVRESSVALKALMDQANSLIAPLQAGVDLDEISEDDRVRWKAWKRYLILLSKTPGREGWPATPDWPATPEL